MPAHDLEILDLVNDRDEVIGQMSRSQMEREDRHNAARVINAFIKNDLGQIWIPRRSANKQMNPLALDMSVGGYVMSGETYDQALVRETMEEVRIDLHVVPYLFLAKFTPEKDGVYAFQQIYEIASNVEPDYNREDFAEAFWMFPKEVLERLENGDTGKSDLPKLIRKIYFENVTKMAG